MSDHATHWRVVAAADVDALTADPDHVAGAVRWRLDGEQALVRLRGAPSADDHLTPDQARELVQTDAWRRSEGS